MTGDLESVMGVAASGLKAQNARLRAIAENIANAQTTATTPGGEPYRRKVVTFRDEYDRALQADTVRVKNIRRDNSDFVKKYDPTNPAADKDGYVLMPNVKPLVETMDMRDAQRSYEANLNMIEASKQMMLRTIDIIRN